MIARAAYDGRQPGGDANRPTSAAHSSTLNARIAPARNVRCTMPRAGRSALKQQMVACAEVQPARRRRAERAAAFVIGHGAAADADRESRIACRKTERQVLEARRSSARAAGQSARRPSSVISIAHPLTPSTSFQAGASAASNAVARVRVAHATGGAGERHAGGRDSSGPRPCQDDGGDDSGGRAVVEGASSSVSSAAGANMTSLFTSRTCVAPRRRASRMPTFTPPENPRFDPVEMTVMRSTQLAKRDGPDAYQTRCPRR